MAEQSYRDRWQTAQFRGIEFLTDSHDAKGGRRLAVHEFPGAEQPLVEDLGGKAWDWSLNAYFIGQQYDIDCDDLLAELNKPGADWLIHPWLGRIWVRPRSWSRRDSNTESGFCTLTIEFVPGGEQPTTPTQDKVDAAAAGIGAFGDAAVGDFNLLSMSSGGVSAFVAAVQGKLELVRQAISMSALPLTWSQQIMGLAAGLKGDVATLVATPKNYANAVRSLTNAVGLGADDYAAVTSGVRASRGLPVDNSLRADTGELFFADDSSTPTSRTAVFADTDRPRLVSRLVALSTHADHIATGSVATTDSAVRINLLADSALNSRLWLTAAMQVALADYRTEADRDAVLVAVDASFDRLLPGLSDTLFQAAVSARTALISAVMAQDLKSQQIRDVVSLLPSTLLSHRMQVDEDVFLARNGVRHPLFVGGRVYG